MAVGLPLLRSERRQSWDYGRKAGVIQGRLEAADALGQEFGEWDRQAPLKSIALCQNHRVGFHRDERHQNGEGCPVSSIPIFMQWLVVMVAATAILLGLTPLIARAEKKAWRRLASWPCPQCGAPFGPQENVRFWTNREMLSRRGSFRLFTIREKTTTGPILRCSVCRKDFRLNDDGQRVDESEVAPERDNS